MGSSILLIVLTLCITQSIHGKDLIRSKRQADISCDEDRETQIITTFLFTNDKSCSQLIGGITDWYDEDYRKECATWLKLDNIPLQVSNTYVSECHEFSNGTTKYRIKICCDGKPNKPSDDQLICFTCAQDPVLYDYQLKYYHTQHCNHYETGPKICAAGEVCAVELNFTAAYRSGLVSKSCMPASVCDDLEDDNEENCISGPNPYCAYCYDTMYGNYRHPFPRPRVTVGPCDPNPCQHGGSCLTNGTEVDDPYNCTCRTGFNGSNCEIDECSFGPCKNGGVCRDSYSPPYYTCGCHIQWTGYDCTDSALLCYENWCLNGGTCYIQEGPDERCLCPTGFVGKSCEYSRPFNCGADSALRTVYRTWYSNMDAYDCTYLGDSYSQRYLSHSSYKSTCYSSLRSRYDPSRPLYKPGVHGASAPHQEIAAYSCEQGRDATWAKWQICCDACDSNPCQNGGWCIPGGDFFMCRCRLNYGGQFCQQKLSSCYASGDPHYYTFDGARMHYQGECKYVMTENLDANTLPYFRVTIKNEKRAPLWPDYVTFPKYAEIEVYGVTVRLSFAQLPMVGSNYIFPIDFPYFNFDGNGAWRFSITMNGWKLQFKTVFGLIVQLSMSDMWTIIIRVPEEAAGRVDGMCRDFNGSIPDDFVLPNGQDVIDDFDRDVKIGDYFYIPDAEDPYCNQTTQPPPECSSETEANIRSNYCGDIEDGNGPFAQCISSAPDMMVESFMENCLYDVCRVYGVGEEARKGAVCGSLAAFADACSSESSPASTDWRVTTGCVPDCPGDLIYKPLTTACRITCANPDPATCSEPDTENCVCESDTDVVLPNDTCAHASVCGCVEEERDIGDAWCNEDFSIRNECVECEDCARPVGEVVTSPVTNPGADCPDLCQRVECENDGECVVDPSVPRGYRCECCPKWEGDDCEEPKRYNCQTNNPCTSANINNDICPGTYHFAHDYPWMFIQCSPWGQCYTMFCPGGLVFDVRSGVCNWSWLVY